MFLLEEFLQRCSVLNTVRLCAAAWGGREGSAWGDCGPCISDAAVPSAHPFLLTTCFDLPDPSGLLSLYITSSKTSPQWSPSPHSFFLGSSPAVWREGQAEVFLPGGAREGSLSLGLRASWLSILFSGVWRELVSSGRGGGWSEWGEEAEFRRCARPWTHTAPSALKAFSKANGQLLLASLRYPCLFHPSLLLA